MTYCSAPGFDMEFGLDDSLWASYDLPRIGKDITVNYWIYGKKTQKTLKWNGSEFGF